MSGVSDIYPENSLPTPNEGEVFIYESKTPKENHLNMNIGDNKICLIHFGSDIAREQPLNEQVNCKFACLEDNRIVKGIVKAEPERVKDCMSTIISKSCSVSIEERCRDVEFSCNSCFFNIGINNFEELNLKCKFKYSHPFKCASRKLSSSGCTRDSIPIYPGHQDNGNTKASIPIYPGHQDDGNTKARGDMSFMEFLFESIGNETTRRKEK